MNDEPKNEPIFAAISQKNAAFQLAYAHAAATIPVFISLVQNEPEAFRSVKLRFRDPDESERLGEDRFLFLWLGNVHYYPEEQVFSGVFFEIPSAFQKWHQVGQHLVFEAEDIFDWMILHDGHLKGGFTLRVTREALPEDEREAYDRHIGVVVYEPLPAELDQGV